MQKREGLKDDLSQIIKDDQPWLGQNDLVLKLTSKYKVNLLWKKRE